MAQPGAVGRISAGAEILDADTPTLGLRRDGAFGSGLTGHAGRLSVDWRF